MTKLKAVKPKATDPKKPKILVFGKAGVGKTWVSLDWPSVYFIDVEGGATGKQYQDKLDKAGGAYFGVDQGSQDPDVFLAQIQALATEKHAYKTVVIDSFSKLFGIMVSNEYERLVAKGSKIEFGIEKKPAAAFAKRIINWLSRIDMNVVIICHEKPEWKQGEQIGETYDGPDKLDYELDLLIQVYKVGGKSNGRVRKTRLESFPDGSIFPWSFEEFSSKYGKEVIEKDSVAITLATSEQVTEIENLLSVIKLPEGTVEKWLAGKQVDKWSEMSTEQIQGAIDHINKTYLKKGE